MPCNLKTLIIIKKVPEAMKSGRKKKHITEKFGISSNTLSSIIRNSMEIDLNFSKNWKRMRGPEFSNIK